MRVRVTMPVKDGKRLREQIVEGAEKVEGDEMGQEEWEVVSLLYLTRIEAISYNNGFTGDAD